MDCLLKPSLILWPRWRSVLPLPNGSFTRSFQSYGGSHVCFPLPPTQPPPSFHHLSRVHYQICSFLIHGYGRKESTASTSPKCSAGLTQVEVLGLKEPPLPRGFDCVSAPTRDWGSIWRLCVSTACRKARWWRCRAGWPGHIPCHGRWLPWWPWSPRPDTPEGRRSPSAKQNKQTKTQHFFSGTALETTLIAVYAHENIQWMPNASSGVLETAETKTVTTPEGSLLQ